MQAQTKSCIYFFPSWRWRVEIAAIGPDGQMGLRAGKASALCRGSIGHTAIKGEAWECCPVSDRPSNLM